MIGLAAVALTGAALSGQSHPSSEMFSGADVVHGIAIPLDRCRLLEKAETAVWVVVDGEGSCLRYYVYGLKPASERQSPCRRVAARRRRWQQPSDQRRQAPEGPRRRGDDRAGACAVPARPGTYGSAGYHPMETSTRREAALVAAQVAALTERYGIRSWVLGGHSGGATLVSALIARRPDIRCAVVSSGAGAHHAYLEAHDAAGEITPEDLNPVDDVGRVPTTGLRVIVMGDPRDANVFFPVQQIYYLALKAHGFDATLVPLEKGLPDTLHSLVTLAEAATGLCAAGETTPRIEQALRQLPDQQARISN